MMPKQKLVRSPNIDDVIGVWSMALDGSDIPPNKIFLILRFTKPHRLYRDGQRFKLAIKIGGGFENAVLGKYSGAIIKSLEDNGVFISELVAAKDEYIHETNTHAKPNEITTTINDRSNVSINIAPQPDVVRVDINPFLVKHDVNSGYLQVQHYGIRYWQPLIGMKAFALWQLLLSTTWSCTKYNQPFPTTLELANTLGFTRNTAVVGYGGNKPRRGIIHTLQDHNLAAMKITGEGKNRRYIFRVSEMLALLTPFQVKQLHKSTQQAHLDYLKILERKTRGNLSIDKWNLIKEQTLLHSVDFDELHP